MSPEEMDMFFQTVSLATCLLNAGSFCFVKSAQEVSCHWNHEVILFEGGG